MWKSFFNENKWEHRTPTTERVSINDNGEVETSVTTETSSGKDNSNPNTNEGVEANKAATGAGSEEKEPATPENKENPMKEPVKNPTDQKPVQKADISTEDKFKKAILDVGKSN